jgi:indole-3-pyruvate monooxygenase
LLLSHLPPRLADRISAPLIRGSIGDVRRLGLERMPYGAITQIVRDGKAPVLDIGVVRLIRAGKVQVFGGVDRIAGSTVYFADGRREDFDAIVAGIGYERNYSEIVKVEGRRFDDLRVAVDKQRYFGEDGLYFCGYRVSPTGQIREIGRDARKIAADIGRRI